jgi:hypothetical protein
MSESVSLSFVPSAADVPPDVDIDQVLSEVARDHVFTSRSDELAPLTTVVAHARAKGVDLSIVVVPANPPNHGDLRDIATAVGDRTHDTVLVLSPDDAGTYSKAYPRVRLEAAEDSAKTQHGQPVNAAQLFVDRLSVHHTVPWTAVSAVVLAGTVATVGVLYWLKSRRFTLRR